MGQRLASKLIVPSIFRTCAAGMIACLSLLQGTDSAHAEMRWGY
jgi:hypothetical protein